MTQMGICNCNMIKVIWLSFFFFFLRNFFKHMTLQQSDRCLYQIWSHPTMLLNLLTMYDNHFRLRVIQSLCKIPLYIQDCEDKWRKSILHSLYKFYYIHSISFIQTPRLDVYFFLNILSRILLPIYVFGRYNKRPTHPKQKAQLDLMTHQEGYPL